MPRDCVQSVAAKPIRLVAGTGAHSRESSAAELITIIILSLFLFYSSFFAEVRRTMNVITLSVTMRNYEGAPRLPINPRKPSCQF